MKDTILFFYPDAKAGNIIPPYSFLYLERTIRNLNLNIIIVDEHFDVHWKEQIQDELSRTLIACTTVMMGEQITGAKEFSMYIKQVSAIPVIWGGWFPTWQPEVCLHESYVDFITMGQGEAAFAELIRMLIKNPISTEPHLLKGIGGLGYKVQSEICINRHFNFKDFDCYPPLNFDLIEIPKYIDYTQEGGKVFRYLSSAGCPYHCSFCFIPLGWKGKWFPKSVDTVINEVKQIISNAPQINYLSFEDLNFFVDHKRVIDICNGFIDNNINISWCATTHVKTFLQQYDDDDIELLKKAGLDCVIVGAESGDQSLLNQVNKQLQISEIFDFIRILDDHGIKTSWSFMILFPSEPGKDLNKTLKLIMQMCMTSKKRRLVFTATSFWPSTNNNLTQIAIQKGFEYPKDIDGYIKISKEGAIFPWHKASYFRKLKYFGMFYFRFYMQNENFRKQKDWGWFIEKLFFIVFRPFILLRFKLKFLGFPFAGWLYCLIFKNRIDKEGYFTPKSNRSVLYQIENY